MSCWRALCPRKPKVADNSHSSACSPAADNAPAMRPSSASSCLGPLGIASTDFTRAFAVPSDKCSLSAARDRTPHQGAAPARRRAGPGRGGRDRRTGAWPRARTRAASPRRAGKCPADDGGVSRTRSVADQQHGADCSPRGSRRTHGHPARRQLPAMNLEPASHASPGDRYRSADRLTQQPSSSLWISQR
jgi:hypothetical protein